MFASAGISFTTKSGLLDASPPTCHMHDLHTFVSLLVSAWFVLCVRFVPCVIHALFACVLLFVPALFPQALLACALFVFALHA